MPPSTMHREDTWRLLLGLLHPKYRDEGAGSSTGDPAPSLFRLPSRLDCHVCPFHPIDVQKPPPQALTKTTALERERERRKKERRGHTTVHRRAPTTRGWTVTYDPSSGPREKSLHQGLSNKPLLKRKDTSPANEEPRCQAGSILSVAGVQMSPHAGSTRACD